eukprot:1096669-Pelagomonas_calceolata.AAC.2
MHAWVNSPIITCMEHTQQQQSEYVAKKAHVNCGGSVHERRHSGLGSKWCDWLIDHCIAKVNASYLVRTPRKRGQPRGLKHQSAGGQPAG